MTNPVTSEYDERFYSDQIARSGRSATTVVPLVNELVRPRSVLDVGCGIGAWLAEWQRQGIADVWGVDGSWVDRRQMQIDDARFRTTDLEQTFDLGRRFDLAECLEVAEHLDQSAASRLVHCIGNHADTVLFGAAIPGQGGTHHVNEQWQSYWVTMFAAEGFRAFDAIRPRIWADDRVQVWHRQNILLLSRDRAFGPEATVLDVVHPELWRSSHVWSARECLTRLPGATRAAVARRLGHR